MWEIARAKLRDWYIVLIALLLFGGGFLASHNSPSTAPGTVLHTASPSPSPATAGPPPQHQQRMAAAAPATAAPPPLHQEQMAAAAPGAASRAASNAPPVVPTAAPKPSQPAAQPSSSDEHAAKVMAAAEPQAQPPAAVGAATAAGGDAAAGRLVFRKCQACHSIEPGKALLGPSLAGIIGRTAGAETNYSYSTAMKQSNIVWDAKTLDAYLADPQKVVPGNKMPFPGLKTEQDRADVVAFFAGAGSSQNAASVSGSAPAPAQAAQQPQGKSSTTAGIQCGRHLCT
jgi:nitrite reductase (NO-forming)